MRLPIKRLALAWISMLCAIVVHAADSSVVLTTATPFDEVKDALVAAIEDRGYVINYTAHIAEMLDRTAADVGSARKIYDRAQILEFCSATLSRRMMEADPNNIVFCPFSIAIYVVSGQGNTSVAYRVPATRGAEDVAAMLRAVVADAVR